MKQWLGDNNLNRCLRCFHARIVLQICRGKNPRKGGRRRTLLDTVLTPTVPAQRPTGSGIRRIYCRQGLWRKEYRTVSTFFGFMGRRCEGFEGEET